MIASEGKGLGLTAISGEWTPRRIAAKERRDRRGLLGSGVCEGFGSDFEKDVGGSFTHKLLGVREGCLYLGDACACILFERSQRTNDQVSEPIITDKCWRLSARWDGSA
jgi:hypothetical protein